MHTEIYSEVRNWMYRNARQIELVLWQYCFENGTKEAVVEALMFYQNEDGGFGHALEADNWNVHSTPITTNHALSILRQIEFYDMSHPIYKGIWKYLNSEKDLLSYGWRFTVPGTEEYPHAPWWNYCFYSEIWRQTVSYLEKSKEICRRAAGIASDEKYFREYGDRRSDYAGRYCKGDWAVRL